MNIPQEIRLAAETMETGQVLRQVCPSCARLGKTERSLTITKFPNSMVKYNCFRGSCPDQLRGSFIIGGSHGIYDSMAEEGTNPRIFKPVRPKRKYFNGITHTLTPFEKEWIWKQWGIKNPPYWYHTPEYGERIAMSVRSPKYTQRGWVLRDIQGTARSKALTYLNDDETPLSWYKDHDKRGTILVEDIPSAVRASKYCNAVALLGTGVGLDRATEIDESAPRPIVVALDQDATDAAFHIINRWNLLWGDVKILPLKFDLKDLQETDLEILIRSRINA